MKVKIVISKTDGHVTIKAVDLTGDAWDDYLYYIEQARRSQLSNDLHGTNRALRAALGNLIAHLEGVVSGVHLKLQKSRNDFKPLKRPDGRCTLKSQILDLRKHAREQMSRPLPYLRLHLKPLRDILVHPTITKTDRDEATGAKIELSELDLFDLTLSRLSTDGNHVSQWLDRLCALYGYKRVHDTHKMIKDLTGKMEALGVKSTGPEPRRM
jgi:regulator of replication initiation timing